MMLVRSMRRLPIDLYLFALVSMVVLATVVPAQNTGRIILDDVVDAAVAFLFFLYGIRLPISAIRQGIGHWRLQLLVLGTTFVLFPMMGIAITALLHPYLDKMVAMGIIFLCILPSTVQSSIAFTSIARGNIAAALCCATLSNIIGVVLSPFLVSIFMLPNNIGMSFTALQDIAMQILLPFVLGQLSRPLLARWIERHKFATMLLDRGSILLIVYSAFSASVIGGIWSMLSAASIGTIVAIDIALLFAMVIFTAWISRTTGFSKEDEIAIVFCGSKKSLASGVPIANILFAPAVAGLIVLPLILYHQAQLFLCATLARRYGKREMVDANASIGSLASVPAPRV